MQKVVCMDWFLYRMLLHGLVVIWDVGLRRFLDMTGVASDEKFSYVPFGAGRHRCIGESFAYVQVKTIMSTLLQLYEFHLIDGRFPNIDKTTMIQTPENPIIGYTRRQPTTHWVAMTTSTEWRCS